MLGACRNLYFFTRRVSRFTRNFPHRSTKMYYIFGLVYDENYQISTEALGGLYVCSLSLNYIVLISSPYKTDDLFYEFIRFSCSFINKIIKSPIKNTNKYIANLLNAKLSSTPK